MKVLFKYCFVALAGLVGLSLASCEDDDKDGGNSAKAVLSSVSSLSFDATNAPGMTIEVVSDKKWTVDAPDWVIVDPTSGSGAMDVTISVKDNVEGGVIQLPRRENICFHGATAASRCEILIIQDGDPFLGTTPVSATDFYNVKDESGVIVTNLTVVDHLADGFIATDGTTNIKVVATETPEIGNALTAYGFKRSEPTGMAYMTLDHIEGASTTASLPEAVEITDKLDTYKSETRSLVKITGVYSSGAVVVDGQNARANVVSTCKGVDMTKLSAHKVSVEAYYAGAVNSGMNVIVRKVEDLGANEIRYWEENFEWLDPFAEASGAEDAIGTNKHGSEAPALTSIKDDNGNTLFDFIESKGYKFVYDKNDKKRIYLQRNYLKFGKTGNHAGITLPSISDVPEGEKVTLAFDWCPQRQGSGKLDPVNLYLIVRQGNDVQEIDIPTHGWVDNHTLEWITAEVHDLTITSTTEITITQHEWEVSTANRWYLDNIRIVKQ